MDAARAQAWIWTDLGARESGHRPPPSAAGEQGYASENEKTHLRRTIRFKITVKITLTTRLVTIGKYTVEFFRFHTRSPGSLPRPNRSPTISSKPIPATINPPHSSMRPSWLTPA